VREGTGVVLLLAVAPDAEGHGLGRSLLDVATAWAFDHGAARVVLGGLAPFYLWPGVDVRFTRMLALADSAGFRETGAALNLTCPTGFRQDPPADASIGPIGFYAKAAGATVSRVFRTAVLDRP